MDSAARCSLDELQWALQEVDRSALLLPARIVRRVIKLRHELPGLRLNVPHQHVFPIDRASLLEIVADGELPPRQDNELPERLFLLPEPTSDELETVAAGHLLAHYWRGLFHGRLHEALEAALPTEPGALRRLLVELGGTQWAEIRMVLEQENLLFAEASDRDVLIEMAATFFELRHFAPATLAHWFPGLRDCEAVARRLSQWVDAEPLLVASRPRGAHRPPDPAADAEGSTFEPEPGELRAASITRQQSLDKYRRLLARAEAAAERTNFVRACILLVRARRLAPEKEVHRCRTAMKTHLALLVRRLREVVGFSEDDVDYWEEALGSLAAHIGPGIFSPEARLLFDLQKICNDYERSVYGFDLVRWVFTLGRRPLKRPLPRLREVLICRHLRAATRRLATVRIADVQRRRLSDLMRRAEEHYEDELRRRIRPIIAEALREAELTPSSRVEDNAFQKLVEELIDRILDRGYLSLGALRDAVARNQIKARDLSGPRELLRGDQLLQADRRMSDSLDGVYRRGEFYLRAMQTLSSIAFGTTAGRFLMRYLVLPFGGAFLVEKGVQHVYEKAASHAERLTDADGIVTPPPAPGEIAQWSIIFGMGLFLLLLINAPSFRAAVWEVLKLTGRALRFAVIELPRRLLTLPLVQRIRQSWLYRRTMRFVVQPALVTWGLLWFLPWLLSHWRTTPTSVGLVFLGSNLLLNSRLGRDLEEVTADWIARWWHWFGIRVVARLFVLIMDVSRASVEAIERVMYSVDEWLRFRSGEGRGTLIVKASLGAVWALVTYVIRFCVNLLIEPQVNPIKHFPVVTVSHKVLLPFTLHLAAVLELAMDKPLAVTVAGFIITSIPGIFGFLAWELRENWRLYGANRSRQLGAVPVGHHGETVRRLLVPGLHSGTIPRHFARLRQAEGDLRRKGRWKSMRKHRRALREVEVAIRSFVEREFLQLLADSPDWRSAPLELAAVQLSTNRIELEFRPGRLPGSWLRIMLEARANWLLAAVADHGLLAQLTPSQRRLFAAATVGLYKMAGIDMLHQEIAAQLPAPTPPYDLMPEAMVVWPEPLLVQRSVYYLNGDERLQPYGENGAADDTLPPLDPDRLFFSRLPLTWTDWVVFWEYPPASAPQNLLLGPFSVDGVLPGDGSPVHTVAKPLLAPEPRIANA